MRWLRSLHRYVGIVAAVLMLIVAVTGGILVFKEEIWRLRFTELAAPLEPASAKRHAAAFSAIEARYGDRVRLVRVPRPGVPAYHVYLAGGEALWLQDGTRPVHEWAWYQSPLGVLTELHTHLAAGDFGKLVLGYLGLVGGLMAMTGIVLWWPLRRQFRPRAAWPSSLRRPAALRSHRDLGAMAGAFIVLFSLTASAVVFGGPTRNFLNHLLAGGEASEAAPRAHADGKIFPPDAAAIGRAQSVIPEARLMSWSPPAPGSAVHYFRFRQPGEPHPYGRSRVYVNASDGRVLTRVDATHDPAGDRLVNWMYPLHAARWGGWPYRMLAALSALALTLVSLTGLVSFIRSKKVTGKPPRC